MDNFGPQKQPHSERQLWAQHKQVISTMSENKPEKVRIIGLNGLHTLFTRPFIDGRIDHHFEGKGVFPFRRSWAYRLDNADTREYYKSLINKYQDQGPHVLVGFSAGGRLVQYLWGHDNCIGSVLHSTPHEYKAPIPNLNSKVIICHAYNDKLVSSDSRLHYKYVPVQYTTLLYESQYWLGHGFEQVDLLKQDMVNFFGIKWEDYY